MALALYKGGIRLMRAITHYTLFTTLFIIIKEYIITGMNTHL